MRWIDMPRSWVRQAAAITISASLAVIPWSSSSDDFTPARWSRRNSRSALLSTIRRWTHEWSLMPSRSAVTCAACQRAFSVSFALTASRNRASRGLRSLGAVTRTAAAASRGESGPSAPGSDTSWLPDPSARSEQSAGAQPADDGAAAEGAGGGELAQRLAQFALGLGGGLLGGDEPLDVPALLGGHPAQLLELERGGGPGHAGVARRVPVPGGPRLVPPWLVPPRLVSPCLVRFRFPRAAEQPGGAAPGACGGEGVAEVVAGDGVVRCVGHAVGFALAAGPPLTTRATQARL